MKEILELNKDFAVYLENSKPQMISDLKNILSDKSIVYEFKNTKADIVAYYFEYEWDFLDTALWVVNKKGSVLNEALILPTQNNSKMSEASDWSAFMPEKIWNKVTDFQDSYDGEDFDEILDEYESEKYTLFEDWFCECWKQTIEETGIKVDAYFSIHDTNYKTDLNTLEEMTDQQIEARYK